MKYIKSVLKNGIRIITVEMPQMKSVATTVYVKAGSRYETPEINGISHFLEHMLFKGTKKYPTPAEIAQAIEGVGGQLNAWTDQDHTAFCNLLPAEFALRGLEVISEMLFASSFDKEAIERERGVIVEEINRQYDNPASYVYELLVELMWPKQPLGWPVIGTKENILKIKRNDFLEYMKKHYTSKTIVVSVAGNIKHENVVEMVKKSFVGAFESQPISPLKVIEEQKTPRMNIYKKSTDQAHLALGVRGLSYADADRYIWDLMNTILGQGMSSRLFLNIREEKGLAYHIASGTECYEDTGALIVHAGLNIEKLNEAIEAIIEEFNKLKEVLVDIGDLRRAKDYVKGMINLSMDDTDSVSGWYGKQELLMPQVLNPEEILAKIESVSVEDIKRVANRVFQSKNYNLAVIGPVGEKEEYLSALKIG